MRRKRVVALVDGFNLYHAIARLDRPHLDWLPAAKRRHRRYVAALVSTGVIPVIGKFRTKDRWCPRCRRSSLGHEEKETDVNIALHLLDGGHSDGFDHALLVSRDSDLIPAVRMLRERFPEKRLTIVAPPLRGHSTEMLRWATGKTKIRIDHLEQSLFPEEVRDSTGAVVATRPHEYVPPNE